MISNLLLISFVLCSLCVNAVAADTPASGATKRKTLQVDGVSYSLDVQIAAGAAGDETLSRGVYLFHLKCAADISCALEQITLNECTIAGPGGPAFFPRVASWSTWSGQLVVRQTAPYEIELTVYQAFGKNLPAKAVLTRQSASSRRQR